MAITKKFLKNGDKCKVTFKVEKDHIPDANEIKILGDFNNWNGEADMMKKLKNGAFTHSINLDCDKEYHFRYLVNKSVWRNEPGADDQVVNDMNTGVNSIVIV